jgi:amphi-Trp domain-containing protein
MTLQQEIAAYLRELADKVERSSHCAVLASEDERMYVTIPTTFNTETKIPTGERQVELKLNYIEENT